jgi:hypothetical protein
VNDTIGNKVINVVEILTKSVEVDEQLLSIKTDENRANIKGCCRECTWEKVQK